jgi:hypothetical protein
LHTLDGTVCRETLATSTANVPYGVAQRVKVIVEWTSMWALALLARQRAVPPLAHGAIPTPSLTRDVELKTSRSDVNTAILSEKCLSSCRHAWSDRRTKAAKPLG